MQIEHLETAIEKVDAVHTILMDMLSQLNLALETVDSLSPAEQTKLDSAWREGHLEAIQYLQESLTCCLLVASKNETPA